MSDLKKYAKYILWIILMIIATNILTFIGFNINYKSIDLIGTIPEQISIEKAEANKSDGRVYGYVSNNQEEDVNGKYILIKVYDSDEKELETKKTEITGVEKNNKKMFQIKFNDKNIKSYSISIVDG